MPISGETQLDPNKPRFGLPLDSCVGDDGPMPTQVTTISVAGSRDLAQAKTSGLRIVGGPASAMAARGSLS